MFKQFRILSVLFSIYCNEGQFGDCQLPPTRSIDLWNPFATTTGAPRLPGQILDDEIIVRLIIGDVIGRKTVITGLKWTPHRDLRETVAADRGPIDPDPLPDSNDIPIFTFLGIPYAEPPVANRRFKPPQRLLRLPVSEQNGEIFEAFSHGPACAQDVENRGSLWINSPYPWRVSEDCLYLNIFTPDASETSGESYPVLVFLHGGRFQTGSANDWPGHILASKGMVVVTLNYRLGPFGFLSLGDDQTGNYGLMDQRLALEWIRDHINSFGGNPKHVTVIGHDAGAVSVGLHMLSPKSTNLFRSAGAMAGSDVSYHQVITKRDLSFNNTLILGRYLGCSEPTPSQVWDCILTRSTQDIIQAVQNIPVQYNRYLFLPTVDEKEIVASPGEHLQSAIGGSMTVPSPVPYLVGLNGQDGTEVLLSDRKLGEFNNFDGVDQQYMETYAFEYAFRHNYTTNREAVADAIVSRYTYWPDLSDTWMIRQKFLELVSDAYYVTPVSKSAQLHAGAGSMVFFYVNNYNFSRGSLNPDEHFLPGWMGSCHECDLYLLFGFPWLPERLLTAEHLSKVNWTETDRNASETFMSFYRQFVRTQNPNLPHDSTWRTFDPRHHWYVDFNYTKRSDWAIPGLLKKDYKWQTVAFWHVFVPSLVGYLTTTFSPRVGRLRKELLAFKIATGTCCFLLMLMLVLAGAFAYLLFERSARKHRSREQLVVRYRDMDNSFPSESPQHTDTVNHFKIPPQTVHKTTNL